MKKNLIIASVLLLTSARYVFAATGFGFDTHFSPTGSNLSYTDLTANADILAANGQSWIRFDFWSWDITPSGTPTTINWTNLAYFDQAVNYARGKGLKVMIVTAVPDFAKSYSLTDYLQVTKNFYSFLAGHFAGRVTVWQVFNEADSHNFRDYTPITSLSASYLAELNQVLSEARSAIKAEDPAALVSTNASGYPVNDQTQATWFAYFDAIGSNLDFLTVDLYPDVNNVLPEVAQFADRVRAVENRYNKPVAVGETGICTRSPYFSEQSQATLLPQYINALKPASPKMILVYEVQDENNNPDDCEGSFGIRRFDGTEKPAFATVMAAMRLIPGDLNGDGRVDILDLRQLLSQFTNIFDYNLVAGNFGK